MPTPPETCGWCPCLHTAGLDEAFVSQRALQRGTRSPLLYLLLAWPGRRAVPLQSGSGRTSQVNTRVTLHVPEVPRTCAAHRRTSSYSLHPFLTQQNTLCRLNFLARVLLLVQWPPCMLPEPSVSSATASSLELASYSDCVHLCV